jgi:hypothetical protein
VTRHDADAKLGGLALLAPRFWRSTFGYPGDITTNVICR